MSNSTITQVRTALKTSLLYITTAHGFNNDILSTHFYSITSPEFKLRRDDASYPKFFIVTADGETDHGVSGTNEKILGFEIIAVVKAITDAQDSQGMIETFIEDIEKRIASDHTLGGVVTSAEVKGFATDGGAAAPEGVVVIAVETRRYWRSL